MSKVTSLVDRLPHKRRRVLAARAGVRLQQRVERLVDPHLQAGSNIDRGRVEQAVTELLREVLDDDGWSCKTVGPEGYPHAFLELYYMRGDQWGARGTGSPLPGPELMPAAPVDVGRIPEGTFSILARSPEGRVMTIRAAGAFHGGLKPRFQAAAWQPDSRGEDDG